MLKPETLYPCSTEMKADLRNCRSVKCTMRKKCGVKGRATKDPKRG